jgi:Toprim domain-containing protein/CHC2-type zinc finger protein
MQTVVIAKCGRIESEVQRRGIRLIGRGPERVGPCPVCGGRDRFSINTKKQLWNCRGCRRGGDVIALVQHLDGADFKTALRTLAGAERRPIASVIKPVVYKTACEDEANSTCALKLWHDASPIAGTLAEQYLRRRSLEPPPGDDVLRFYSGCPFGGARYSCLLALFRDILTNEPRAIHRIALTPSGIATGKKMLGPVAGCAVKLDCDVEQGLVIGEGVETSLAGMQLGFRPAWALGSASAIKAFPVLGGIEALTILVDHDAPDHNSRRAGQEAARTCAKRWAAAGREVRLITPNLEDSDIADILSENELHERLAH